MKRLVMIALLFGFFACTQTPAYKINVKLDSAKGIAYLSKRLKGDWVKLDSAMFENGICKFDGVVKNPDVIYLIVSNSKEKLPFFIENSVISINGKVDSLANAKVSGSTINDEYQTLQDRLDAIDRQGMALFNQAKDVETAGNKVKADSIKKLAETISNSVDEKQKEYIKAHPASYISPFLLNRLHYNMEADVLESFLAGLDAKLDSLPTIVTLKGRVAKLKTVAIGQTAPDFTMNDVSGNPLKLSDVYSKNEYTLIDFWASWCGPCRRENPNVVAVFNSFKAKGFGVFGISLDADKVKWIKAISDDKLTWPHVSDLRGWKNAAAAIYVVNSIPSNLLVDKTGKIISRNLREEKLRETITGLLNK